MNFFNNPYHVASYDNTGGPIISKYGSKTIRLMRSNTPMALAVKDMRTLSISSI
ncbi:hypothetical protein V1504DRAFT_462918 [Lipomyces starkeyi]